MKSKLLELIMLVGMIVHLLGWKYDYDLVMLLGGVIVLVTVVTIKRKNKV